MEEQKSAFSPKWQKALNELTNTLKEYDFYSDRTQKQFQFIRKLDNEIQNATVDLSDVYELIFKELKNYVKFDHAHIMEINGDVVEVTHSNNKEKIGKKYDINNGLCGVALKEKRNLNIGSIINSQYAANYHEIHEETQSELVIRMEDRRETKILGLLNLEKNQPEKFTETEVEFCELVAGQLCIAFEQVKIWNGIELISNFNNQLLSREDDLGEIYQNLLDNILKILDFNYGQIVQLIKGEVVVIANSHSKNINHILKDSVIEQIIAIEKSKKTIIINDLKSSRYFKYYKNLIGNNADIQSELVVPLIANNEIIGAINIEDTRISAFSKFDVHIIEILSRLIANTMIADNVRSVRKIEEASKVDFVLAQLGHISVDHLHQVGGDIANLKFRLNQFLNRVEEKHLPNIGKDSGKIYLQTIHTGLINLEKHVKKLKIDYNPTNMDLEHRAIDIVEKTDEVVQKYEKNLPKGIYIDFQPYRHPTTKQKVTLECLLSSRFSSILEALINNAIEAMPTGGKITISFDLVHLLKIQLSIKDEGKGIQEEHKDKIYNYAFTTKANYRGQGLGMWFVKTYIERFGGTIRFNSELNKGTTFYITFPLDIV